MAAPSVNVLMSWIGISDLKAAESGATDDIGPIARTAGARRYTHIYLLNDHGPVKGRIYQDWLSGRCKAKIPTPIAVVLPEGPTQYETIYQASRAAVEQIYRDLRSRELPLEYQISAGTPAMSSMLIILAKTSHRAELVEASKKKGVRTVPFMFDLAAEFLPDLIRKDDDFFTRYAQGLIEDSPQFESIIGRSPQIVEAKQQAAMLAIRDVPMLILGESGTGKELFARAIHSTSGRKMGECVVVNCGAIPPQLFESEFFGYKRGAFTGATQDKPGLLENAQNGTIFLDEIGDLPLDMQVKLLRVLGNDDSEPQFVRRMGESKERRVNFRLIAATNRDLQQSVREGRFREDLFFRIAVGILKLPPLRERTGDLSLLSRHILDKINRQNTGRSVWQAKKLAPETLRAISQHGWPGNVRELYNTLTRAAIGTGGDTIRADDIRRALVHITDSTSGVFVGTTAQHQEPILGRALGGNFSLDKLLAEVSAHYLERAYRESGGRKNLAAQLLGFKNWQTFDNRRKKYAQP
ncbi:MAG TPA: sigma 54-interacting transcriptional regulator [Acidobacteriota bacterium]|nr:sigma 54-interacting transcriptional regulator [Acidobacteriota bacterium]HQM63855.1 sigma 54-interacting transcriptional regulator [Acidobacteriota bacterium]